MDKKHENHEFHRMGLTVGGSVDLDLYKSPKGMTAVVSIHFGNPFNHGVEIQHERPSIAEFACKELGCKPHEVRYIEQNGQHFQDVPLAMKEGGGIDRDPAGRITGVTRPQLAAEIARHEPPAPGGHLLNAKDWGVNLKISAEGKALARKPPDENGPSRKPPSR